MLNLMVSFKIKILATSVRTTPIPTYHKPLTNLVYFQPKLVYFHHFNEYCLNACKVFEKMPKCV